MKYKLKLGMHRYRIEYRADTDSKSWIGYRDSGADLFNSILCLYSIYIIYWNLNSCLSFDQFVAALKRFTLEL